MSHSQDAIDPLVREYPDIVSWLLAIAEVVNTGSRLAPQKAFQKQLQELIDIYGSERVWEGIKQLSLTFGLADALTVEALFQSHPDLPSLLRNKEEAKRALSQWFERNSARVGQARQLFYGLGKLVPHSTTSKFAVGEVTPEHKEILGEVFQILGKESNDEEGCPLR